MRAREVKVRVPVGVTDGQRIRVKGRGAAGANGGPPGDLFVVVHVSPHPLFGRSGNDLMIRLPVTFAEATLGADVKVPTLDGQVTVRIPPGTPSGKCCACAAGVGDANGRNGKQGDLLVTSTCRCPTSSTSASDAVRSWRRSTPIHAALLSKADRSSDG
jgi:molecular chaperone DnaJ